MNKKPARQNKIISLMKERAEVSVSDILSFLSVDIDRKTLQRDLKELEEKFLISKKGIGKSTVYAITEINKISLPVNIKEYFDIPYLNREVKESFNFEIFNILSHDIFTAEEKKNWKSCKKNS